MRTWFKTLTSSGGTFCKAAIVSFKVNTPCWRTTDIPGKRESLRGGIICGDGRSLSMLTALSEFFCSCIVFNWAPACNQHNTNYKCLGAKKIFDLFHFTQQRFMKDFETQVDMYLRMCKSYKYNHQKCNIMRSSTCKETLCTCRVDLQQSGLSTRSK